ncbi:MAG: phosphotransferase [Myxococcales bacterium]|nr:aminoglycoside phosphotransferase family protein [Myxococcota bacterium]MDW8280550.1 phosphotransferase [Myxococcales bacterium]
MSCPLAKGPALEAYLTSLLGRPARLLSIRPLGESQRADSGKGYGYGVPLLLEYEADGQRQRAVLETIRPGPFGHEHMADRAQQLLWDHRAFGQLPRHVRAFDVGILRQDGGLQSLGQAEEFFLLMEFAEGEAYATDLRRLQHAEQPAELDLLRCDALCDYLVQIHAQRGPDPGLYARRIRELVGHGECIMGLTDSYPEEYADLLRRLEHRCLDWRWRIKGRSDRLRQVHGDFHPWNILFRQGTEFCVLDRARGEWGEPADDVVSLSLNYLFFSLQGSGRVGGALGVLFQRFWQRYLSRSGDPGVLQVAAPFVAFRGLVLASPRWYPDLPADLRRRLFIFMERVLEAPAFDPERAASYLEG